MNNIYTDMYGPWIYVTDKLHYTTNLNDTVIIVL